MNQLNKWQQDLDKLTDQAFKQTDNELFNLYRNKLIEIKKVVKHYCDIYPELSFSKKLEVERQLQVGTEIQSILKNVNKDVHKSVKDFAINQGEMGYNGVFYAIEGAENVTLPFTLINHEYINKAFNHPVAGKSLSARLYKDRNKLAKTTTQALIDGLWDGYGYAEIAKRISDHTEASYKRALRIARTEGGRVRSLTTQHGYDHAVDLGIDLDKKWLATNDGRTRHDHSELNGQIVPHDGKFTIKGYTADGPRLFGVASEDINCRCTTVPDVKDVPDEYRKPVELKKEDKPADYGEFVSQHAPKSRTFTSPSEKLLQKHAEYIKSLSAKERESIVNYTGAQYGPINDSLMGRSKMTKELETEISSISKTLKGSNLSEDSRVYRGIKEMPDGLMEQLPDDMKSSISKTLKKIQYGFVESKSTQLNKVLEKFDEVTVKQPSFMSTSHNPDTANAFGDHIVMDLEAPKELHGLAVESISDMPTESEILFDKGYNVVIEGITYDKKSRNFILKGRIADGHSKGSK